jgi:predicted membrane protein
MKGVTIFENIIGILVALMILFQILPSRQTSRELNNPVYIVAFLIFLVAVFSVLNPVIGLLLLIYGYQILVQGKKEEDVRNKQLAELNPERAVELEERVIQNTEFTRIKNQYQDQETRVTPVVEKLLV